MFSDESDEEKVKQQQPKKTVGKITKVTSDRDLALLQAEREQKK